MAIVYIPITQHMAFSKTVIFLLSPVMKTSHWNLYHTPTTIYLLHKKVKAQSKSKASLVY